MSDPPRSSDFCEPRPDASGKTLVALSSTSSASQALSGGWQIRCFSHWHQLAGGAMAIRQELADQKWCLIAGLGILVDVGWIVQLRFCKLSA
jgi:hypothetical protein